MIFDAYILERLDYFKKKSDPEPSGSIQLSFCSKIDLYANDVYAQENCSRFIFF